MTIFVAALSRDQESKKSRSNSLTAFMINWFKITVSNIHNYLNSQTYGLQQYPNKIDRYYNNNSSDFCIQITFAMSQTIIQIPNIMNNQILGKKQYLQQELNISEKQLIQQIMYLVGSIRDPQRQQTLQQLNVITEDSVTVNYLLNSTIFNQNSSFLQTKSLSHRFIIVVNIEITPTVPHCHLTQQIGLAIRMKLKQELPDSWSKKTKIIIRCKPGSHNNREQVQKQINDKERIAAALENQSVVKAIKELIKSH